jgi:CBS domain-containing protein
MKISAILAKKGTRVFTITPEITLKQATLQLREHKIGALPVVDSDGRAIGILSERDIVRRAAQDDDVLQRTVGEVMTRDVVYGTPQDDLTAVLATMTERRFRHLPVIEHGQLIGIISIGDLIKAQLDEYRGEIDTLETRITEG